MSSSGTRYDLALTGKVLPGRERGFAVAGLARMLDLTESAAEELLKGQELVIERNVDGVLLARYEAVLQAAGVEMHSVASSVAGRTIIESERRTARIRELEVLARELEATRPPDADLSFQKIDPAWVKRLLRERPFAILAVLSLAGCLFIRHGNTFSVSLMMTAPMIVGAGAGFVFALSAVLRDPDVATRHPMLFGIRNALFYAVEAALVAGMTAIVLAYAANRWIPSGPWEWRVLQVRALHLETGRHAVSSTDFVDAGRCCLGLSGTGYGGDGALVEFRMRRGVLGYWVYSDYRPVARAR